ncbi:hypothetical protein TUM4630_33210 [Shewanella algidipiscicola]|uniref:Uncharacterized protein n=1 Tax=Shewanella algidipiscicola TaxID=614070 RepID=A0ABQ4NSN5_9GAMM|nr:hypothetical protein TUM4630_33210 [Shewanella algidipiscicola]
MEPRAWPHVSITSFADGLKHKNLHHNEKLHTPLAIRLTQYAGRAMEHCFKNRKIVNKKSKTKRP